MKTWLMRLIEEKGIDTEEIVEVEGKSGTNFIPLSVILEHILAAPKHEQEQMRKALVMIDFRNGDITHYFKHLAACRSEAFC